MGNLYFKSLIHIFEDFQNIQRSNRRFTYFMNLCYRCHVLVRIYMQIVIKQKKKSDKMKLRNEKEKGYEF